MSARGTGNVVEKQNVETFGAGTITTGDALIEILPVNEVDFGDSATVTAYGDLMVSAGTDTAYSPDYYNLEARFDGIAGSLVPIDQTDAKAYLVQENNITIGSGAWLKTAREALLHAEDLGSQNDLVAKAKITSWTSGAADGLLALTGGGADQYNGHLLQEAHATVTNNGTVETGITRHQFLTLNGWDAATGAVTGTASDGVTFHTENKVMQSSLATDLRNDQQQLATYGDSNPTMKATLLADIANIQQQMIAQHLVEVESDGSLVPIVQYVMTVVVDPMWAQAGRIDVQSDQVQGSGQWIAPTDASVTITNNTPAFLELKGITIPDDNGRLFVNGILVGDNPSIQTINQAHADLDNSHNYSGVDRIITPGVASFAAIPNATPPANQDPQVTVANTLNVNTVTDGHTYQFPNITVLGPSDGGAGIYNLGGAVTLQTTGSGGSGGSIIVNGPLFAKTQSIIAGGNVYINDPGGSVSVAGEPSSVWGAITTGVYDPVGGATAAGVASAAPFIPFTNTQDFTAVNNLLNTIPTNTSMYGQRIFIKANIINVNGIMQSGKDNYTLNLDTGSDTRVADEIKELLLLGATGRFLLPQASARNPDFTVFFNTATNSIEVAGAVTISGGHIDLDGSILNTGNGQIRVLGGYGQINVVNNTAYGLQVDKLDASQRGDGVLTILDHAKPNAVNGNPLYTVYTQNASGTTVTTDDGAGHVTTSSTIPAIYQVAANWRYGWTVGYQQSVIDSKHIESSNWLGAINLGTVSFNDYTTVNQGAPTLQGAGGYYYLDTNPLTANNAYDHSYQDITTSAGSWKETFHDVRSTWYGKKTYISDYQRVQGHEILNTHDISAHRDIGIQFFGASEAAVNVISTSNQDVVIGAILNTTGTTTVASGGAITELGGGVIGGRRVVLTAATGLGTAARALAVKVVNPADAAGGASSLSAVTSGGNINIADNDGVLAVDHVVAAAGDVTLTASKGIVVGMQDASTWYEGLVQGGAIVLNAGATTTPTVNPGGPIGNSIAHPLVVESGSCRKTR